MDHGPLARGAHCTRTHALAVIASTRPKQDLAHRHSIQRWKRDSWGHTRLGEPLAVNGCQEKRDIFFGGIAT